MYICMYIYVGKYISVSMFLYMFRYIVKVNPFKIYAHDSVPIHN